jgi:hypothetical protein
MATPQPNQVNTNPETDTATKKEEEDNHTLKNEEKEKKRATKKKKKEEQPKPRNLIFVSVIYSRSSVILTT